MARFFAPHHTVFCNNFLYTEIKAGEVVLQQKFKWEINWGQKLVKYGVFFWNMLAVELFSVFVDKLDHFLFIADSLLESDKLEIKKYIQQVGVYA